MERLLTKPRVTDPGDAKLSSLKMDHLLLSNRSFPSRIYRKEVKKAVASKYPTAVLRKAEKISRNGDLQYEVDWPKQVGKRYYSISTAKSLKRNSRGTGVTSWGNAVCAVRCHNLKSDGWAYSHQRSVRLRRAPTNVSQIIFGPAHSSPSMPRLPILRSSSSWAISQLCG
jgi:hypothetical protein